VGVIHHQQRLLALSKTGDIRERRAIAIHAEYPSPR